MDVHQPPLFHKYPPLMMRIQALYEGHGCDWEQCTPTIHLVGGYMMTSPSGEGAQTFGRSSIPPPLSLPAST